MSIEEANELTQEQKDAFELLNQDEDLRTDQYAIKVVNEGGKVESGKIVSLLEFLVARSEVLKIEKSKEKLAAAQRRNPDAYAAAVIHSVRPDIETRSELI